MQNQTTVAFKLFILATLLFSCDTENANSRRPENDTSTPKTGDFGIIKGDKDKDAGVVADDNDGVGYLRSAQGCTAVEFQKSRCIVTAAHCADSMTRTPGTYLLQTYSQLHNQLDSHDKMQTISLMKAKVHPFYRSGTSVNLAEHDLAVIWASNSAHVYDRVSDIATKEGVNWSPKSPSSDEGTLGSIAKVIGYGYNSPDENGLTRPAAIKRTGNVELINHVKAGVDGYTGDGGYYLFKEGPEGDMIAPGDSGGPLFVNGNFAGITSWRGPETVMGDQRIGAATSFEPNWNKKFLDDEVANTCRKSIGKLHVSIQRLTPTPHEAGTIHGTTSDPLGFEPAQTIKCGDNVSQGETICETAYDSYDVSLNFSPGPRCEFVKWVNAQDSDRQRCPVHGEESTSVQFSADSLTKEDMELSIHCVAQVKCDDMDMPEAPATPPGPMPMPPTAPTTTMPTTTAPMPPMPMPGMP